MCYGLPQDSIPVLLQYSCLIRTLSTQRILLCTVVKVGGCMGQGPVTEVTHLRLYQPTIPPVFCSKKSWRNKAALGQGTLKMV